MLKVISWIFGGLNHNSSTTDLGLEVGLSTYDVAQLLFGSQSAESWFFEQGKKNSNHR